MWLDRSIDLLDLSTGKYISGASRRQVVYIIIVSITSLSAEYTLFTYVRNFVVMINFFCNEHQYTNFFTKTIRWIPILLACVSRYTTPATSVKFLNLYLLLFTRLPCRLRYTFNRLRHFFYVRISFRSSMLWNIEVSVLNLDKTNAFKWLMGRYSASSIW